MRFRSSFWLTSRNISQSANASSFQARNDEASTTVGCWISDPLKTPHVTAVTCPTPFAQVFMSPFFEMAIHSTSFFLLSAPAESGAWQA